MRLISGGDLHREVSWCRAEHADAFAPWMQSRWFSQHAPVQPDQLFTSSICSDCQHLSHAAWIWSFTLCRWAVIQDTRRKIWVGHCAHIHRKCRNWTACLTTLKHLWAPGTDVYENTLRSQPLIPKAHNHRGFLLTVNCLPCFWEPNIVPNLEKVTTPIKVPHVSPEHGLTSGTIHPGN